jgi:hypothetical protein
MGTKPPIPEIEVTQCKGGRTPEKDGIFVEIIEDYSDNLRSQIVTSSSDDEDSND